MVSFKRALWCGLIMIPPWLKTLSTGADVAGTDCTFIASSNSLDNSFMFFFQNSKQSWTSSPHWHIARYFWYSAMIVHTQFNSCMELLWKYNTDLPIIVHTFDMPDKIRRSADGIIYECLLTRTKFIFCRALRWLRITQQFKIRVAKFYYFRNCRTIGRLFSRRQRCRHVCQYQILLI